MNKNPNHPMVKRMLNGFTGELTVWKNRDKTRCVKAIKNKDTGSVTLLGKVETDYGRHHYNGYVKVVIIRNGKPELTRNGKTELREMIKTVVEDDGRSWLK